MLSFVIPKIPFLTILSIYFSCITTSLLAQFNYKFQQLSVDEGLKNSRVVSVVQDKEGYMWMATHNGLDKFNGTDIKHYSLSASDSVFSNDDIINCLVTSDKYDILCGTKNGNLYSYHRKLDIFQKVLPNEQNNTLFNIYAIHADNENNIWIGTTGGLYHFHSPSARLTAVDEISQGVNAIIPADENNIWIGSARGLHLLNKETNKTEAFNADEQLKDHLSKVDILTLYSHNNNLFVGTRRSEVTKLSYKKNEIKMIAQQSFNTDEKNYPVTDILCSPDQENYVIAIDGIGIFISDKNLKITESYVSNDNDLNALSSNGVYELCYSKDNILWVATYGGGINFADPNKKQFNISRRIPHINNSLRNNAVNSIVEHNNNIWFGTKTGISIYNFNDDRWKHIPSLKRNLQTPFHVMSMCIGHDNSIWTATYGRGLIKIDPKSGKRQQIQKYSSGKYKTETNHLYQVISDSQGRIWTGGIWGGLSVIDERKQTYRTVNITNVRSICEVKNSILVGTLFGLFIVDKNTFEVTRPQNSLLIKSRIICIEIHSEKDKVYLGTDVYGLLEWDFEKNQVSPFANNSLPSSYIRGIIWDKQNRMWLSSTGGLSVFNDSTKQFDNYNVSDGLANTEFSENAVCLHSSGQLLFGGPRGISWFFPSNITKSNQETVPIISSAKLFGQTLNINENGPLTENINSQNKLLLKHDQNTLSFSFGAICYTNPQKIKYKWTLEGFEDQWNGPTSVREAIYSKLPHGNYTLKLMVTNDDGIWQNHIKTIEIEITPPFWKRPVAYVLYAFIMLALILLILHYYHIIVQERHSTEKQQFFISIAHDLRTPLSLIKLPVEKMVEESNEEDSNLSLIKRNIDRLSNLVNQLLDFQKADLKKMQLQVSEYDINSFTKERVKAFEPLSKEKNINVTISFPNEPTTVWFDRNKMEKVMYNLLSNAFKYTPKNGEIKVCVMVDKKFCTISVDDTGEGIPAKQQKNIFQHYYRATNAINSKEVGSGVGLMLTKEIVELHKGDINFESTLGEGSVFWVKLLLGNQHYSHEDFSQTEDQSQLPTPIVDQQNTESYANVSSIGIKLLIVEDNPELLEALKQDFSKDYNVFGATNGKEGLEKVNEYMPDIIISDVMMPEMNGHQLCQQLKNDLSTCHIPIILLTALDSPDYKREGLEHGADAYLEKPFDLKLLRAQVSNLLKSRQQLRKKFQEPESELKEVAPTNADEQFLEKIKSYVIENIDKDELSVESTAIELGMSRPVLYRKIKSLTDLSPQQLLMTVKLKEAARILKEENKNISETAYMTGFTDPKYFSQTFKKYFGMTPSEYLKK